MKLINIITKTIENNIISYYKKDDNSLYNTYFILYLSIV